MPDMSSGMVETLLAAVADCDSIAVDVISPAMPIFEAIVIIVFVVIGTVDNID
ncbi:hypothetical protein [Psychrobacter coccoides]|uniref:hypothetical protein n=1 Tax=Psychrobacter coccoides TaxID=2818440 RepID=UPI001FB0AB17|nr:hypothetical protein [Psychrobacter coccoides]